MVEDSEGDFFCIGGREDGIGDWVYLNVHTDDDVVDASDELASVEDEYLESQANCFSVDRFE
jgi:hypothetical protein